MVCADGRVGGNIYQSRGSVLPCATTHRLISKVEDHGQEVTRLSQLSVTHCSGDSQSLTASSMDDDDWMPKTGV